MSEIWIGPKGYMQWVTAPAVDVPASKVGYTGQASFLNGGAWVRRSKVAAKQLAFSWNMKHRDEVQPILDMADGIYGNAWIYYCNPFVMDRNVFPSYWAAPFQNYYDGPAIIGGIRPALANANASTNGYPAESAVYTITSSSNAPSVFLPIPPGYTMHIGAHGSLTSGSANVTIRPELSAISSGAVSNLTLLTKATTVRTNATVVGGTNIGVTVSLASASTGVLQLDGLIAQCLPTGTSPAAGGFISGQGQSGMSFINQPALSEYSAALDRVGVSCELVETEAWAWQ